MDVFTRALLQSLCKRMVAVLKESTPGEHLPDEWTYTVESTGKGSTAKIYNTRAGMEGISGTDEAFQEILLYLDQGTEPHRIAPRLASALRFSVDGQVYFSKGHVVSGIQASFFSNKATRVLNSFESTIEAKLNRWINDGVLPR